MIAEECEDTALLFPAIAALWSNPPPERKLIPPIVTAFVALAVPPEPPIRTEPVPDALLPS
jgi:hypothetical protein